MRTYFSAVRFGSRWPAIALVLALGLAAGACSDGSRNLTGPSVVPSSLGAHGSNGDRYYAATITPGSTSPSVSSTYTVTFTNCNGAGTCDGAHQSATNGNSGSFASASIAVPAGFSVTSAISISVTGGKSWSANLVGSTIILGANSSTGGSSNRAIPGDILTISFTATWAAGCDTYPWNTAVYQDALSGGAIVTTSPYTLVGTQPTVVVTGCSAATQACSPGFWKQDFHFGEWPTSPQPTDLFSAIFNRAITVDQPGQLPDAPNPTLAQALKASRGGVNRAARIGTAAYLSAVHPDVAYPYTAAEVIQAVQDAIDGAVGTISIDDLENVWKDNPDHCPLGADPGEPS
jgi:hypothetical protein